MTSFSIENVTHGKTPYHDETPCPFINAKIEICTAAVSLLKTDEHRRRFYCDTDDYDNCPFFISKSLRSCIDVNFSTWTAEEAPAHIEP